MAPIMINIFIPGTLNLESLIGGRTMPGCLGISGAAGAIDGFKTAGASGGVGTDGSAVMRRGSMGGIGKEGILGAGACGVVTGGVAGAGMVVAGGTIGAIGVSAGNFIFGIGGGGGGVLGALIAAATGPASPSFLARSKSCAIVRIEYCNPCVVF